MPVPKGPMLSCKATRTLWSTCCQHGQRLDPCLLLPIVATRAAKALNHGAEAMPPFDWYPEPPAKHSIPYQCPRNRDSRAPHQHEHHDSHGARESLAPERSEGVLLPGSISTKLGSARSPRGSPSYTRTRVSTNTSARSWEGGVSGLSDPHPQTTAVNVAESVKKSTRRPGVSPKPSRVSLAVKSAPIYPPNGGYFNIRDAKVCLRVSETGTFVVFYSEGLFSADGGESLTHLTGVRKESNWQKRARSRTSTRPRSLSPRSSRRARKPTRPRRPLGTRKSSTLRGGALKAPDRPMLRVGTGVPAGLISPSHRVRLSDPLLGGSPCVSSVFKATALVL